MKNVNRKISISAELYEKADEARSQLDISLEEFCESAIASLLVKMPVPVAPPKETVTHPSQTQKSLKNKGWGDFRVLVTRSKP